jgi:hypothetical protein
MYHYDISNFKFLFIINLKLKFVYKKNALYLYSMLYSFHIINISAKFCIFIMFQLIRLLALITRIVNI